MKKILIIDGFGPLVRKDLITKLQEQYAVEIAEIPEMNQAPNLVEYAQELVEKIQHDDYDLVLVPKGYTAMHEDVKGFELSEQIKAATNAQTLVYGYSGPEVGKGKEFVKLALEEHPSNYCQIDPKPEGTIWRLEESIESILKED